MSHSLKAVIAVFAGVLAQASWAAQEYTFTFIPELQWAFKINENGQFLGHTYSDQAGGGIALYTAYAYDPNRYTKEGLIPTGLTWASDINDSGQVIGRGPGNDGALHAFRWDLVSRTQIELETVRTPVAINNQGQVVGEDEEGWSILWEPRTGITKIRKVDEGEKVRDINNSGTISGIHTNGVEDVYGFPRYTGFTRATDVTGSCPACLDAHAINDNGYVVSSYQENNSIKGPVLWKVDGDITNYSEESKTELTFIDTRIGWGNDLNNKNQVVGRGLWTPGVGYTSFSELVPNAPFPEFMEGFSINDKGQIVGFYTSNQAGAPPLRGVFLLTPINESTPTTVTIANSDTTSDAVRM